MALTSKQEGNLIMLVVITVFALNIPISKYMLTSGYISPMGITLTRMSFAAIAFWLVSLFMPREKVEKKDMLILLAGGMCGMLLNQGFFAFGLGRTSSVDASIIATNTPLFTMIIAAIILKEPITMKKAGGVLVGATGAIFLVFSAHRNDLGQGSDVWGNVAIVGSSFCYAFYLVITRPLSAKYSPITMMKWMFLCAALGLMPFFYKDVIEAPLFYQTDVTPFLLICFTLLGATFFTYMMIPFAQRRIRPTTISMYNNLQPLIASFVAVFMGIDTFSLDKGLAGLLIFAGVYLVTQSKSKADIEAALVKQEDKTQSLEK